MFALSQHARQRKQQRAVRGSALEACIAWGQVLLQPCGRTAFHLGHRELELALRQGCDLSAFRDTAVILAADGTVVTVIRTPDRARLRRYFR